MAAGGCLSPGAATVSLLGAAWCTVPPAAALTRALTESLTHAHTVQEASRAVSGIVRSAQEKVAGRASVLKQREARLQQGHGVRARGNLGVLRDSRGAEPC